MSSLTPSWTPDWPTLWRFGACWAGRPVAGIVLPGAERLKIMKQVIRDLASEHPVLPGELQTYGFVQGRAVHLALGATREERLSVGQPDLWHDPSHTGTTPVVELLDLQADASSPRWTELLSLLRPRAIGFLRGQGVDDHDAEDLFSEAMAGMVKPRSSGMTPLQDLVVYEQLPPLFLEIVRKRWVDHVRHRQAEKRSVRNTVALSDDDASLDDVTFSSWAADAANPMKGLTLARLADECAHRITPLQHHILRLLYIDESASYMEVANAPWFAKEANLKPGASDATRRRALDTQHDSALEELSRALGISRPKS